MRASEAPLIESAININECVESIAGGLRETLYVHNIEVRGSQLTPLRALAMLSAESTSELQLAAQSLLTFLEQRLGSVPITCDRNQIILLLDSLLRHIRPLAQNGYHELALQGKAPAYQPYSKQPTCLFLDSDAAGMLLEEVASTSGHCVENVCGLPHVVVNEQLDTPLTIIADLSTLRDDSLARSKIARLRQVHPQTQLFCLSSATHFAARLEAVRLGASRFLIKQFDIDKLILILDGISTRKETLPFRGLLVDNGRALTALHVQAVRAAARNAEAVKETLYPDAIASEAYVTGCWSLQLGVARGASTSAASNAEKCAAS